MKKNISYLALLILFSTNFVFADPHLVQQISLPLIPDKKTTDRDFQLYAVSENLTLELIYSTDTGNPDNPCSVTQQGLVHIIGAGTCTIYVDQNGNENYLPANQISRSFEIKLPGPNNIPVLVDTKFGTTEENKSFTGIFFTSDLDGDELTFTTTKPDHGTITNITRKTNEESSFIYTPDKNFYGTDHFTFKANDGKADSEYSNGTIIVTYIPQPAEINILGNNPLKVTIGDAFVDPGATAADENGNDLTAILEKNGTVDTNTAGNYIITYSVSPVLGLGNSVTRTVKVSLPNQAPTISIKTPTNNSTISGIINITASSSDDDAVIATLFYIDNIATTSTINTNALTNTSHTITAVAKDAENLYATSTVTITVNNVVSTPVVSTPSVSSGGGGGGGSYVPVIQPIATATKATTTAALISTASSTKIVGQVLGVSTFFFRKNLSFGNNNNDVKELQKVLIALKFMTVSANGNFGPATKKALIAWQKANKITPTSGYFGPLSRAKMNQ